MKWWQTISEFFGWQEDVGLDRVRAEKFLDEFWGGGKPLQIDLYGYIERFVKKEVDPLKLPNYSIATLRRGLKNCPNDFRRIAFDAEYNLILLAPMGFWKRPRAIACIGFNIDAYDEEVVIIKQLQAAAQEGLRNSHIEFYEFTRESLRGIKWERMLVAILLDLVFEKGFKRVEMIRAEQSKWYAYPYNPISTAADIRSRMKMRYDVTAKRMGFDDRGEMFVITKENYEARNRKRADK